MRHQLRVRAPDYYGSCRCKEGYTASEDDAANCVPVDKCADVHCDDTNAACSPDSGECTVCNDGYTSNDDSPVTCTAVDKCDGVTCDDDNAACSPDSGICVCNDGYTGNDNDDSSCVAIDSGEPPKICEDLICTEPNFTGQKGVCVPGTTSFIYMSTGIHS